MATIKVILGDGESPESVAEFFMKSLVAKEDEVLKVNRFDDPVMNQIVDQIDGLFRDTYVDLVQDIVKILKKSE